MCVNATRVKLDDQAPMLILFTAHWDPESPLWETRACDGDIPLKGLLDSKFSGQDVYQRMILYTCSLPCSDSRYR